MGHGNCKASGAPRCCDGPDGSFERIIVQSGTDGQLSVREAVHRHHHHLRELGDHCVEMGSGEQARKCYSEAARLAPDEPGPYVGLGTVYLQAGLLAEADWAFRVARRLAPACAEALGGLAMTHQRRREYPAAFEMYLKCLELDTDNLVALLGLFQTSCQMGTFAMITRYLERYLQMPPGDATVLFCLATLYAREGKLRPAREALARALEIEPEKREAAHLLSVVDGRLAGNSVAGAST